MALYTLCFLCGRFEDNDGQSSRTPVRLGPYSCDVLCHKFGQVPLRPPRADSIAAEARRRRRVGRPDSLRARSSWGRATWRRAPTRRTRRPPRYRPCSGPARSTGAAGATETRAAPRTPVAARARRGAGGEKPPSTPVPRPPGPPVGFGLSRQCARRRNLDAAAAAVMGRGAVAARGAARGTRGSA